MLYPSNLPPSSAAAGFTADRRRRRRRRRSDRRLSGGSNMSAIVCGKRSNSIFDDLLLDSPPVSKRIRFSSSARFSPPRQISETAAVYLGLLSSLRALFPAMDQQLLERALEASGNDLDSAIRSLNDLHLGSIAVNLDFTATHDASSETNVHLPTEGIIDNNIGNAASENQSSTDNLPKAGSEWVDLVVREMMSATDVEDARARTSRILEVLEKSIVERANAEANEVSHKEKMMLKEQVEVLLQQNTILKRAVAIQHESQQEYAVRNQEVQHLKQTVSQYQEQLKTLEMNNYALTMHLKQAQQSNSIPGHFHPDIF